jgi:hypothetical protein
MEEACQAVASFSTLIRLGCKGRNLLPYQSDESIALLTGLYEKVIKVKADVAAVLVSATQRFREWRWTLSRAPFFGVHLDP